MNDYMDDASDAVRDMMLAYGQECHTEVMLENSPELMKLLRFRLELIREEFQETMDAYKADDMVEFVDGLGDVLVVSLGAAHALGIQIHRGYCLKLVSVGLELYEPETLVRLNKNITELPEGFTTRDLAKAYWGTRSVYLTGILENLIKYLGQVQGFVETLVDLTPEDKALAYRTATTESFRATEIFKQFLEEFVAAFDLIDQLDQSLMLYENFNAIIGSNMQKFCKNLEEVEATQAKWAAEGVETYHEETGTGLWRVKRKSDGKMVKPASWQVHNIVLGSPELLRAASSGQVE